MLPTAPQHRCQSCHSSLEEDEAFCPVCGQKRVEHPATLRELLGDAISNVFALDSKLLRTLVQLIFRPGSLSVAYWKGARQRYYTPFKLFLFWVTVFVLLVSWKTANLRKNSKSADDEIVIWRYHKSITPTLQAAGLDSVTIDSLLPLQRKGLTIEGGVFNISAENLPVEDLYNLPLDSLVERYSEGSFVQDLLHRQFFKAQRRPGDFGVSLLGNLSWIIFLSLPLLGLLFFALFPKRQPYYTAHLAFTLHLATMGLFLVVLFVTIGWLFTDLPVQTYTISFTFILLLPYTWLAMRRAYQQSRAVITLKLFLFSLGFIVVFGLSMFGFLLLNFLIF